MALLTAYLPLIACFFLKRNFMKLPSGWWLFLGQLLYLHEDNAFKAKSQSASEKQTKKQKKQAAAAEKVLRDMDNSDVVTARIMNADTVRLVYNGLDRKGTAAWPLCDDLDLMVTFFMISMAIFLWHVLALVLGGGGGGFITQALLMPATTAGIALITLYKCNKGSDSSLVVQWLLSVLGVGATISVLLLAPTSLFDFGLEAGAKSLEQYFGAIGKIAAYRLEGSARDVAVPRFDPAWLAMSMAFLSAFIAPAASESAMRMCKAVHHATLQPYWMPSMSKPGALAQGAMLLSLPLALVASLAQVRPLAAYWGVHGAALALWWPALMGALALLLLAVARPLMKTYFTLGLFQWYSIKHQNPASEARSKVIDAQMSVINRTACKVAIHFVGPAILLACLCMLLATVNGSLEHLPRYDILPRAAGVNATLPSVNASHPAPSAEPAVPPPTAAPLEVEGTLLEGLVDESAPGEANRAFDAMLKRTLLSAFVSAKIPMPKDLIVFVATYLSWFLASVWALSAYFFMFVYRNGMHL